MALPLIPLGIKLVIVIAAVASALGASLGALRRKSEGELDEKESKKEGTEGKRIDS